MKTRNIIIISGIGIITALILYNRKKKEEEEKKKKQEALSVGAKSGIALGTVALAGATAGTIYYLRKATRSTLGQEAPLLKNIEIAENIYKIGKELIINKDKDKYIDISGILDKNNPTITVNYKKIDMRNPTDEDLELIDKNELILRHEFDVNNLRNLIIDETGLFFNEQGAELKIFGVSQKISAVIKRLKYLIGRYPDDEELTNALNRIYEYFYTSAKSVNKIE